ncbi:MAG: GYD domain-containing protein [Caldilineaceae bacterium]
MNRYLVEMQLAPQAFAAFVKNPSDRQQANAPVNAALGGKLVEYYFGVGSNTVYCIMEFPDQVSLEAVTMAILASGSVLASKCVGILTASEAVAAMEMAGGAGYRAPASK